MNLKPLTLLNAFSLNLLPVATVAAVYYPITAADAANLVHVRGVTSAIGHADTARVVAHLLDVPERAEEWAEIAATRPTVKWDGDGDLLIAQYSGPRLPEGATALPEGATIQFWLAQRTARFLGIRHTWGRGNDLRFFADGDAADAWAEKIELDADGEELDFKKYVFPVQMDYTISD